MVCRVCALQFGLVHISAGDLLRAEVQQGTPNGTLAKSFMDAGQLVPDEVVVKASASQPAALGSQPHCLYPCDWLTPITPDHALGSHYPHYSRSNVIPGRDLEAASRRLPTRLKTGPSTRNRPCCFQSRGS